ncbi:hypothetical protein ES703_69514 [subsurface metagenome]
MTEGTRLGSANASASPIVRLLGMPLAPIIVRRFVPISSKREVISAWAPLPTDIRVITAPTPIMTPNMVREERNLFANSDLIAITRASTNFTFNLLNN